MVLDKHVHTLSELDILSQDQAHDLAEQYDYPGQLFTDLHYTTIKDYDWVDVDLPVDTDPKDLHREMYRAGMTYYTGKQLYLESERGTPPDGHQYVPVEGPNRYFDLLGVVDDTAHYFRTAEDKIELEVFEWLLSGDLGEKQLEKNFDFLPVLKLESYVEDRDWSLLREPDFDELFEQYNCSAREVDLPVDEADQASFDHWEE